MELFIILQQSEYKTKYVNPTSFKISKSNAPKEEYEFSKLPGKKSKTFRNFLFQVFKIDLTDVLLQSQQSDVIIKNVNTTLSKFYNQVIQGRNTSFRNFLIFLVFMKNYPACSLQHVKSFTSFSKSFHLRF